VIRFVGETLFAPDLWVGVELAGPWGKNDGSVQGVVYFHCCKNCGIFVRTEHIEPIAAAEGGGRQPLKATSSSDGFHSKSSEEASCGEQLVELDCSGGSSGSSTSEKENLRPLLVANNSCLSDSNGLRCREFTALWKSKLSDMMELVGKQWELVKEMEGQCGDNNSVDVELWKERVAWLCSQEMELASNCQKKLANI